MLSLIISSTLNECLTKFSLIEIKLLYCDVLQEKKMVYIIKAA